MEVMRERKHRAWHGDGKKMIYAGSAEIFKWKAEGQSIDIMDYCGLKDANGVEIYEGDVVACDGLFDPETGQTETDLRVVEYRGPSLALVEYIVNEGESREDILFVDQYIGPGVDQDDFLEVIGNIYEHPELIAP